MAALSSVSANGTPSVTGGLCSGAPQPHYGVPVRVRIRVGPGAAEVRSSVGVAAGGKTRAAHSVDPSGHRTIRAPRRRLGVVSRATSSPESQKEEEETEEEGETGKGGQSSDSYTDVMQQRMGGGLKYVHEDGINFAYVLPDLIVGSCPQNAADVDRLAEMGVGAIFCLQEDHDAQYFGFEVSDIQARCEERGDIQHVRAPVRDFDPFSLRLKLPGAVATLHAAKQACPDKAVYVHCTAGLGRAPGTALAYMYWIRGYQLMEAHSMLMEVRPCHPKLDAIRAATCDILFDASRMASGLDVGWGEMLDFEYDKASRAFVLERELLPGFYPFKFIWDGHWGYSADHPTYFDGEHINNFLQVPTNGGTAEEQARKRLTSPDSTLNPEERAQIETALSNGKFL